MPQRNDMALRLAAWLCLLPVASCSQGGSEAARIGQSSQSLLLSTTGNQIGRLTSTGAGAQRTFNRYDALGRITGVQYAFDGASYLTQSVFGYPQTTLNLCASNACGSGAPGSVLTAYTFPDGEQTTYGYDAGGNQQSVTTAPCNDSPRHTNASCTTLGSPAAIVVSITRNVRGQTVQLVLGNGTEQDSCYNDGANCAGTLQPSTDLRLNQIRALLNASNTLLQNLGYSFDAGGNVTAVADNLDTQFNATYGYDSLGRLTSAVLNGVTSSYGYDVAGNLTNKEGAVQTYGGAGRGAHALQSAAGLVYTYDANGNLSTRSDGLGVVWDAHNMPAQVSGGAATTTTQKFFTDESLWKKVQGATTTYYMPSLRMENGAPRKFFGVFAERDVDGSLKFYENDLLGSSVLVTDAAGTVVHRASYRPYGEDRSLASYTPPHTESFTPRYQFTFKEKEQDGTNFYDFGARLYNPATGRWLSADSDLTDGPNRYAYVRNNPLTFVDRTGHFADWPPGPCNLACQALRLEISQALASAKEDVAALPAGSQLRADAEAALGRIDAATFEKGYGDYYAAADSESQTVYFNPFKVATADPGPLGGAIVHEGVHLGQPRPKLSDGYAYEYSLELPAYRLQLELGDAANNYARDPEEAFVWIHEGARGSADDFFNVHRTDEQKESLRQLYKAEYRDAHPDPEPEPPNLNLGQTPLPQLLPAPSVAPSPPPGP